ncbi:MAG: DegV family protein [Truepera sp.]|nr:DegV family protein [Truepera sp.]
MPVGIVTDSTCDLPAARLLKLGVAAVPLRIIIGDEVYRDWRDVEPGTLYRWMLEQGVVPQVTPPEVADFTAVYRRYLSAYDEIISIHHASTLSDTLERAVQAALELGASKRIHHLDSYSSGAALAELVMAAARQAANGATAAQVIDVAEQIRERIYTLLTPASLEWLELAEGISRSQAWLSKLFRLRPIFSLQDGELVLAGSVRQSQVTQALIRQLQERFDGEPLQITLAVAGREYQRVDQLRAALSASSIKLSRGRVQLLGPQLGAYLGPGTLAVCAYPTSSAPTA